MSLYTEMQIIQSLVGDIYCLTLLNKLKQILLSMPASHDINTAKLLQ